MSNYYISSSQGSDQNSGTDINKPWKTLTKAAGMKYYPGDKIHLKCGDIWNEQAVFSGSSGTRLEPIELTSYGDGPLPIIHRNMGVHEKCLIFNDVGGWKISNLEIGNTGGIGVLFFYNRTYCHEYLHIENCRFHNIYGIDQVHPAEGEYYQFSAGIGIGGAADKGKNRIEDYHIKDIYLKNNYCCNCASLLVSVGSPTGHSCFKRNLYVENCVSEYNTIYGIVISGTVGGWMKDCRFFYNGTHSMKYGSAGIMLGNLFDYKVINTEVAYQQRKGVDPDGCGIDFEVNCFDVGLHNCKIHHNAGVGVMMYGQKGAVHQRCTVEECTFQFNNQNPFNPSGYEVFYSGLDRNNHGIIQKNRYVSMKGVSFINECDPSVKICSNYEQSCEFLRHDEIKTVYDSCVDFSISPGKNGWDYYSRKDGVLTPLIWDYSKGRYFDPLFPGSKEYYDLNNPGCFVARRYQLPYGNESVRLWRAPQRGIILITAYGHIRLAQDGDEGTIASIQKNEDIIWGPVNISSELGVRFSDMEIFVEKDDVLYFILKQNGNSKKNLTFWNPLIIYKEKQGEPTLFI